MTRDALNALSDENLRGVIAQAETLLKERDKERKESAVEQARAILSQAGLSLRDLARARPKPGKALIAGSRYENPDNPAEVYIVGKGRPPLWFGKLRETRKQTASEPKAEATAKIK